MRIITYNVNGIRAAQRKGLEAWLAKEAPDVFCLQEVKAMPEQVDLKKIEQMGYHTYWHAAEKKGYSGVATFSKKEVKQVFEGMKMPKYDAEGRLIRTDFQDFTLINAYFPSGSRGGERQQYKYEWLSDFQSYIGKLQEERQNIIICGDVNICHKPIDIHNPKTNKNTSGFLPEEREWFSGFLETGFADAFRQFNEDLHHYTWWTYRSNARARNVGWRIDYFWVSESMKDMLSDCQILPSAMHSDHCPVRLDLRGSIG